MFCPKCRTEHRDNCTECPQCKVLLVGEPPSEDRLEYGHFVKLMTASDGIEAEMVRSILEEHGMPCLIQEYLGDFIPGFAGTLTVRPLSCPVAIQVLLEDADEARRLLKTECGVELEEPHGAAPPE